MKAVEIKACPFCGCVEIHIGHALDSRGRVVCGMLRINCTNCNAEMRQRGISEKAYNILLKRWNRRES